MENNDLAKELEHCLWMQIMNCLPVGMIILSNQGEFCLANDTCLDILSLNRKEFFKSAQKKECTLLGPDTPEILQQLLSQGFLEASVQMEKKQTKDKIVLRIIGTSLDYGGQSVYLLTLLDISATRETEDTVYSGLAEIETQCALVNSALNSIAHNIQQECARIEDISSFAPHLMGVLKKNGSRASNRNHWTDAEIRKTLSKREYQVLMFIREGIKLKDISDMTGLDTRTVGTYKSRALKKLNIEDKKDLNALMQAIGPK